MRSSLIIGAKWLDLFRFRYGSKHLIPSHQLRNPRPDCFEFFEALGNDPQFRLRNVLSAGWYMVELEIQSEHGTGYSRFYLDQGAGESEENSYCLPYRNGKIAKRLLYLARPAHLRFDPTTNSGGFELRHFRLVRTHHRWAVARMQRKLDRHLGQQVFLSKQNLSSAWITYDGLFSANPGALISYRQWIQQVEKTLIPEPAKQQETINLWSYKPLISIIMPTWNTPIDSLMACIDSVLAQTYEHWELCVADDASTQPQVRNLLTTYVQNDDRIRVEYRGSNGHICEASNTALRMANGDFVAILDHDDTLASHALFFMVASLQSQSDAILVYSDEDKLDIEGKRCEPFFKPDWSPDLLYAQNYVCHFSLFRRSLLNALGGFRVGYEGSQDYDLILRCIEKLKNSEQIVHVPMVLYHWRQSDMSTASGHQAKHYATDAAVCALEDHMRRTQSTARISVIAPGLYRAHWPLPRSIPLVSLIVPTKDGYEFLSKCIESILCKTHYPAFELLIVDNQSVCPITLSYLDELVAKHKNRVRVLRHNEAFNFSAINNMAAREAKGELLGLINNDVEVINPEWLNELVSHAVRPEIGCVGAKLLYSDRTIQHAGVVLGIGGVAGHSHKHFPDKSDGYFGRLRISHNVSAVTAAVLLLRKSVFESVGGFNEKALPVAFNDVDLCLRISQTGLRHVWTPFAELFHHESKTRGYDTSHEKIARFAQERDYMIATWGEKLLFDPYYNPNLTLSHENYGLHTGDLRHRQRTQFENV